MDTKENKPKEAEERAPIIGAPEGEKKAGLPGIFKNLGKFSILIVLVLFIIAGSLLSEYFLTSNNLLNILLQASINLVIALGMTFVITTAGIDLSVGAVLAVCGMVMAKLLIAGLNLPLTILITLLAGALMGTINGLLITRIGLPPFIATLGTQMVFRGIAMLSNDGKPAYGLSAAMLKVISGRVLTVPIPVIISLIVALIMYIILTKTTVGEYALAIGGNEEATRLSGVPVKKYKTIIYAMSGVMAAIAAIILTARMTAAEPIAGSGYETDAIAAAVIGGTSLAGGVATITGTIIGAFIMSILRNILNLLNIQSYYQLVAIGIVIVVAVGADTLRHHGKR